MKSSHCTLCDDRLLRHLRKKQLYWFCPTCRQDMLPHAKPIASPMAILVCNAIKETAVKETAVKETTIKSSAIKETHGDRVVANAVANYVLAPCTGLRG